MKNELKKVCVMASFPKRKESMLKVVESISKQCDVLCLWLNEYNEVPIELQRYNNLDIRLDKDFGRLNIKDAGKFAFLDKYYDCYYLTIDDDINYPKNYVHMLTRNIDRYGRKCIIAYHGHGRYPTYKKYHYKYIAFYETLNEDHLVNIRTGTGVTGFVPNEIHIPILTIDRLHTIDTDVSFGVWANNNNISMICCAHRAGWLKNIKIGNIRYDQIQKLTGTQELNKKRAIEIKKLKRKRNICNPVLEAKILCKYLSII